MIDDEFKSYFSGYDKVDYRQLLQKQIEKCYQTIGSADIGREVKILKIMVSTIFPGMNLKVLIEKKEDELYLTFESKMNNTKKDREVWYHPLKRGIAEYTFAEEYWMALLEYIRDVLAEHRGLLWGIDTVKTGKESGYNE